MKFSSTLTLFSLLTVLVPTVSAHGFVHQIVIDGTSYVGNPPNADPNPSPLRQVSDVSPVKGASNPSVNCGLNAQLASQVADAKPGSTVQWDWRGGDLSHWPHNTGPMMTYMASCGSTTCDQYNSTDAKWFLIDRVGQFDNGNGSWVQDSLRSGALASVQVPSNLAPGNYIMRHEIIALHLATQPGGAEFYPGCAQLRIGGSQTGTPQPSDLVSLPGAYKDTDPGIFDPNVFDQGATYTFPGPPVASFISGSSGSSGGNGTSSGSGNSGNSTSGSSGGSSGSDSGSGSGSGSGSCRLRRKSSSSSSTNSSSSDTSGYKKRALMFHHITRKPRPVSRIMRDLLFGRWKQRRV